MIANLLFSFAGRINRAKFWLGLLIINLVAVAVLFAALAMEADMLAARLVMGLIVLYLIASSKWIDQVLFRVIGWAIKRFTALDTHDYEGLLHLGEGYAVVDIVAETGDWVTGNSLAELRMGDEGLQVLAIHRSDGAFIGAPRGDTFIRQGDKISIWGQTEHLKELHERRATREGEYQHEQRVREQQEAARREGDQRGGVRQAPN